MENHVKKAILNENKVRQTRFYFVCIRKPLPGIENKMKNNSNNA
jgi:hypothetical protein